LSEDSSSYDILLHIDQALLALVLQHITVIILVEFSHESDLTFLETHGSIFNIRIFAECPCVKLARFRDNPRYYVNYDQARGPVLSEIITS
jgi:hypothetical protein